MNLVEGARSRLAAAQRQVAISPLRFVAPGPLRPVETNTMLRHSFRRTVTRASCSIIWFRVSVMRDEAVVDGRSNECYHLFATGRDAAFWEMTGNEASSSYRES